MRSFAILSLLLICSSFAFYTENGPVTILNQKNFEQMVLKSNEVWMVEFFAPWCGHCKAMKDEWIKAAGAMGGIVHFGAVDATVEQSLASQYGIQGFPTIKVFSPIYKSPKDYQNARDAKSFCKTAFASAKELVRARLSGSAESSYNGNRFSKEEPKQEPKQKPKAPEPVEVKEITNQEQFDAACKESTCMLLIVPDIRDAGKTQREEMIATMKAVADKQISGLFKFGWLVGGTQYDMEQKLNLGFGYPAVIAISGNKGRYAVHTGSYTEHNLNVFIQGLQLGSARTRQLPELPPFVDVAPWDGKDAPVEEDVDDLEVEISCVCLESVCDD